MRYRRVTIVTVIVAVDVVITVIVVVLIANIAVVVASVIAVVVLLLVAFLQRFWVDLVCNNKRKVTNLQYRRKWLGMGDQHPQLMPPSPLLKKAS